MGYTEQEAEEAVVFVRHIKRHLKKMKIKGKVCCKICDRDIDDINNMEHTFLNEDDD
jgi:hypothetical protein